MPPVLSFWSAKWPRSEIATLRGTGFAVAMHARFFGASRFPRAKRIVFLKSAVDELLEIIYLTRQVTTASFPHPLRNQMNPSFIPAFITRTMTKTTPSQFQPSASSSRLGKAAVLATAIAAFAAPSADAIVLDTGTLVIAPTGVLDLKNNNLIVRSGNLATLTGYITTGLYNGVGGFWDGPGINSSVAAVDPNTITAVGIIDNSLVGYTDWPPLEPVSGLVGTEILIKYTYFGDADLNGVVDITDYGQIDTAFNTQTGTGWLNGDFDYSGGIPDITDYGLIDTAFALQGGALSPSAGAAAPVPEPGSLTLLCAGLVGAALRRRR